MDLPFFMDGQNVAAQGFYNPEAMQNSENLIAIGSSNNKKIDKNVINLTGKGNAAGAVQQDGAKPDNLLISLNNKRDEVMNPAEKPDKNDNGLDINLDQASDQEGRAYKEEDQDDRRYAEDSYQSQRDRESSQNYNSGSAYDHDDDEQNQDDQIKEYSDNGGEENEYEQNDYEQGQTGNK